MHPFGGPAICERCNKSVYAAEQVIGPGRKLYHKPCLACMICNKRLDSFSLLEHDQKPYCKSCHVKNFGTKDLRSANLPHKEDPPASPYKQELQLDESEEEARDALDDLKAPLSDKTFQVSYTTLGRSNSSATAAMIEKASRPVMQTATGTRYGAALGGRSESPVRKWGGTVPSCPRCGKSVYFAEQVKAVGKTYHKGCLRCTECNTLLDSTRLRDHEGTPLCNRCYSKLHGPQGGGYALLGKAGG